ncbi:DJ-1 family glyoxalase III [Clostridium merdae]|uniref:DJ-1 family glyoxalase III n=1 Tax=Clostridium merdae TaxID=1958780 RepID=UPI000A271964|nr:DJ-1 family glyoxalase III [Clostridium merdae]
MTYLFLANGFEELEAFTPIDLLRRANVPVQTVGVGGKQIVGAHQIPVIADLEESEISLSDLDMVILPGGLPGTPNLEKSQIVKDAVMAAYEKGAYVAAICAAPSILGHMGLLKGKRATVSDGFVSEITGAEYTGELVTMGGKIITGRGPMASVAFALQLVDLLADKDAAEKLRNLMQCQ